MHVIFFEAGQDDIDNDEDHDDAGGEICTPLSMVMVLIIVFK